MLLESANRLYPNAWSPDGRHLLFQEVRRRDRLGSPHAWRSTQPDARSGAPKAFAASPFHESSAAISPDGRWMAYESDELDGIVQIYVRSWPDGAHKVLAYDRRRPPAGVGRRTASCSTGRPATTCCG